jgi:hypothetical protein
MVGPDALDRTLRLGVALVFFAWNLLEGAVFTNEYPAAMVKLYVVPIWRLLLVGLLYVAADWCPTVAIMIAFTLFFYYMDMEVTLDKWSVADLKRA